MQKNYKIKIYNKKKMTQRVMLRHLILNSFRHSKIKKLLCIFQNVHF